jgi:hypothetical protein
MKFVDLWESSKHLSPAEQQKWLRHELLRRLGECGARLAHKGHGGPDRIVLGIAEYAHEDLRMLDSVCDAASALGVAVEVFLMTECKSQSEIEEYVPAVGPVFQSPVTGIWRAGYLYGSGSGPTARALLRKELHLP